MSSEDKFQAYTHAMVEHARLRNEIQEIEKALKIRAMALAAFARWVESGSGNAPHLELGWASADATAKLHRELAQAKKDLDDYAAILKPIGWQEPK